MSSFSGCAYVALGIAVNNCIIIQSYVLVNKEQQQCVEAVFSHAASKTTLYKTCAVMSCYVLQLHL